MEQAQEAARATEENKQADIMLPADFAERIGVKIITTFERSLDESESMSKVSKLIHKHLFRPGTIHYFVETISHLLKDEETKRFAGLTWISLLAYKSSFAGYDDFIDRLLRTYIENHMYVRRKNYVPEFQMNKSFSAEAHDFCEVFIHMIRINNEYYEAITEIYSLLINKEMILEQEREKKKEAEEKNDSLLIKKKKEQPILNVKKLYDDIVDYLDFRGDFKSESLNQKNPNEFISALADRLRNTRRYIIQDIMNRFAMDRKKRIEKELSERIASAEEIISANEPFKKGLLYYWWEKRYNLKYLAIEKVRVTIQVLTILLGLAAAVSGYMGGMDLTIPEGTMVGIIMVFYAKFFCSRRFFAPFYPEDKTKELELEVGGFTAIFRKMSKDQLAFFLVRQLRMSDNKKLLDILPEYVKYVFSVMPERQTMVVGAEELGEIMEIMDIELNRSKRKRIS